MAFSSEMSELDFLGAMLMEPSRLALHDGTLKPEHFYVPALGEIYKLMLDDWRAHGDVSMALVAERLKAHPAFADGSAGEYLRSMAEASIAGLPDQHKGHARAIYELYAKRSLEGLHAALGSALASGDVSAVAKIKGDMERLSLGIPQVKPETALDQLRDTFAALKSGETPLKTGFRQWDNAFGGLSKRARYIVAAYGGAGKTAFALQMARAVAKNGHKVRYVDFENGQDKMWRRLLARELKISARTLMQGNLAPDLQARIVAESGNLSRDDFMVFYNPSGTGEIISLCGECDLIVIDGVSSYPAPAEYTKIDKAGWVGDQCARISDATGAAVLMLSHINSDAVKAGPSMAGIYGGQAASFDPEGILEIRRANAEESGPFRTINGMVLKNRYGEVGVKMTFHLQGEFMTFYEEDYARAV